MNVNVPTAPSHYVGHEAAAWEAGYEMGYRIASARPQAEPPSDKELEAWRAAADELLRTTYPNAYTFRQAASLLQDAYLFAREVRALQGLT